MSSKVQTSMSALILLVGLALLSLAPYGSCACNSPVLPAVGPTSTPTVNPVEAGDWYFYKDDDFVISAMYPATSSLGVNAASAYLGPYGLLVSHPAYTGSNWSGGEIDASNPGVLDLSNVKMTKSLKFWFRAVSPNNNARFMMFGLGLQSGHQKIVSLAPALASGDYTWHQYSYPLNATFAGVAVKWDAGCSCNLSVPFDFSKVSRFMIDCNCSSNGGAKNYELDEVGIF